MEFFWHSKTIFYKTLFFEKKFKKDFEKFFTLQKKSFFEFKQKKKCREKNVFFECQKIFPSFHNAGNKSVHPELNTFELPKQKNVYLFCKTMYTFLLKKYIPFSHKNESFVFD